MKKIIRSGVFETNSSSTHSLSIKNCKKNSEIDNSASFEIRSPLAKAVQILGLIDNAEANYFATEYYVSEEPNTQQIKKAIVEKIKVVAPEKLGGCLAEELSLMELCILLDEIGDELVFGEDYCEIEQFFKEDDFAVKCFLVYDRENRKNFLKFKNCIVKEYAKIANKGIDEAIYDIEFEAFANVDILALLKEQPENLEQKLNEMMKFNFKFKRAFEDSGESDIVSFTKKYLVSDFKEFKELRKGKFSCERYFCNGCLDSCNCGFESYCDIEKKLGFQFFSDEELEKKAQWLLSDSVKFVAIEKYSGFMLEQTGEIY